MHTPSTLGVFILWLSWFSFNPGSQLTTIGSSADIIALVAVNNDIVAEGLIALALSWLRDDKPVLGFTLNDVFGRYFGMRLSYRQAVRWTRMACAYRSGVLESA